MSYLSRIIKGVLFLKGACISSLSSRPYYRPYAQQTPFIKKCAFSYAMEWSAIESSRSLATNQLQHSLCTYF